MVPPASQADCDVEWLITPFLGRCQVESAFERVAEFNQERPEGHVKEKF